LGASDISAREYPSGDGVDGRLLVFNIRPLHVLTAKKKKNKKRQKTKEKKGQNKKEKRKK